MSVNKAIKRCRKEKKLTQCELARNAGISNTYLSDIERERSNPSIETLNKIAEALQIDIKTLFE